MTLLMESRGLILHISLKTKNCSFLLQFFGGLVFFSAGLQLQDKVLSTRNKNVSFLLPLPVKYLQ